eukprot:GHVL01015754.1.p1 GENE.GHVL01015754.1~~GHVL01015754.1.p1  ORF type:complete len:131 (+),score=18.00 GHVL01015754.1:89-481(+)
MVRHISSVSLILKTGESNTVPPAYLIYERIAHIPSLYQPFDLKSPHSSVRENYFYLPMPPTPLLVDVELPLVDRRALEGPDDVLQMNEMGIQNFSDMPVKVLSKSELVELSTLLSRKDAQFNDQNIFVSH